MEARGGRDKSCRDYGRGSETLMAESEGVGGGGLTVHLLSTQKMREHRCYAVNHHQLDTAI